VANVSACLYSFLTSPPCQDASPLIDGGAAGAGGALAAPLLRRVTFYFVLVYGTYKEIKKKKNKKTKEFLGLFSQRIRVFAR